MPAEDADLQRILWFENSDVETEPVPYRLTTHVFGAVSSPSCANYALQQTTTISSCSEKVKQVILKDFYVDHFMKSVASENEMIEILEEVRKTVSNGGFNLTGFFSNSRPVLDSIPKEHLAKGWREINFSAEELPRERALGVIWMTENDCFSFRVDFEDKPPTRRGILSTVASIYDPLGLAAPIIVSAKLIFQRACENEGWDLPIEKGLLLQWDSWVQGVRQLKNYQVHRYTAAEVNSADDRSLHIFCDGSERAFGAVAYSRCQQINGEIKTCFLMAKTRLVPKKSSTVKTIPRIELNAAKLAVQLYLILKKEATLIYGKVIFWSDSTAVLSYLRNKSTRFQRFVAHRLEFICENTDISQWRHVPGEVNIADILTKGYSVQKFQNDENWKRGPKFLQEQECNWPQDNDLQLIPLNELEVKKESKILSTKFVVIGPALPKVIK